jgi:hypothetical protein
MTEELKETKLNFDEVNVHNACTTAIAMRDGISTDLFSAALEAWGCGCLEFMQELALYAIYSEQKLQEINPEDYPGVYDYEVSGQFGRWYADFTVRHGGHIPSPALGREQLDFYIARFFNKEPHP